MDAAVTAIVRAGAVVAAADPAAAWVAAVVPYRSCVAVGLASFVQVDWGPDSGRDLVDPFAWAAVPAAAPVPKASAPCGSLRELPRATERHLQSL